jgi:hypothetical protein
MEYKLSDDLSDDDLALSMFVFIERYGERMIKATSVACSMIANKARDDLDGTSGEVWDVAAQKIYSAYDHLEWN